MTIAVRAGQRGFSLIEIMLAVGLMTIIMLGLLAMFYQTQRAMRVGTAQVDVMGTGDAAIHMIATELKQIVAAGRPDIPHLSTRTAYPPLLWARSFGSPQGTYLQELFFVRRENDNWIGTGYFVDPVTDAGGAGALFRFERTEPMTRSNALDVIYGEFLKAKNNTVPRLADRVAHLQLHAFDTDGNSYITNNNDLIFTNTYLPAYVDIELGVIEPKPYDRFKARYDTNNPAATAPIALAYLTNQLDRLHLFRRRIPIRTLQ